jgi:hypothetical protein
MDEQLIAEAKAHRLWPAFEDYAVEENIGLGEPDDWFPWWSCFKAGIDAQIAEES